MKPSSRGIFIGGIVTFLAGLLLWVLQHGAFFEQEMPRGVVQTLEGAISEEKSGEAREREIIVEEVMGGLEVPWSVVFTAPNRILVTSRPGKIYQVVDEKLLPSPIASFPETVSEGEEGLMGLALHPQYAENRLVYASLAYQNNGRKTVKVVRFRDEGDRISDLVTILDNIPAATNHAGSRIKFGPDGKLYVTTGDASERHLAQDMESLAGKILRLNADGTVPGENPFPGSPAWSLGHRNPQGIAWHPETGEMYATEHGPSGFDGPGGGDEVNHIVKGGNYGWPLVSHKESQEGMVDPLLVFTPAEAPAGAAFYVSDRIPQFTNQLFFASLRGQGLTRVKFDEKDPNKILEYEKLSSVDVGRVREVVSGPDGALYFTTSNRDGRGNPRAGDDKIYRIRAK